MLKEKFELLLNGFERYVEQSTTVREKISQIKSNGDFSDEKKERDCDGLKAGLKEYAEKERANSETIAKEIRAQVENASTAFNVSDLQGVFIYLQSCGEKATADVVEYQLAQFRGNPAAIKTILQAAENNGATPAVIETIKKYIFLPEDIENKLIDCVWSVYVTGASATDAAKKVCKIAALCGVDITTDIKDEFTDHEILLKAFGLLNK